MLQEENTRIARQQLHNLDVEDSDSDSELNVDEPVPPESRSCSPAHPIRQDFVPMIDDLKVSLDFIPALEDAKLDKGGLSLAMQAPLGKPIQEVLEINDPNHLFSLKQFLAVHDGSQQSYEDICDNHNDCYKRDLMLSYYQVRAKLPQWSGVEKIEHDMCPNSCMAYTGPLAGPESCLHCGVSRWNQAQLKNSKGRVKVGTQKFCTSRSPVAGTLAQPRNGAKNEIPTDVYC